jgi:hypothetical protein
MDGARNGVIIVQDMAGIGWKHFDLKFQKKFTQIFQVFSHFLSFHRRRDKLFKLGEFSNEDEEGTAIECADFLEGCRCFNSAFCQQKASRSRSPFLYLVLCLKPISDLFFGVRWAW